MLRIRLRRPGKSIKGRRHQKIVVTEKSWARESKFVDEIGYYDPGRELLKIDTDKYKKWVDKGAQPSETMASLFKNYGKPKKKKVQKSAKQKEKEKNQELKKEVKENSQETVKSEADKSEPEASPKEENDKQ